MIEHLHAAPVHPERVVIAGGSGFIGSALDRCLGRAGIETLSLASRDVDLSADGAAAKLADWLRPSDALVFASAITRERGRDVATLMRNLKMGQAVVDALGRQAVAHVVYVSSDAVYGDQPVCPLLETTPCVPVDLYGVMHLTRERMLEDWAHHCGLPLLIVRPTLVYGHGDPHNSYGPNRFMRAIRDERRIRLFGAGDERRDHIDVEDVAEAIRLALVWRSTGVVNLATGNARTFAEVAELMRQAEAGVVVESTPATSPVVHRDFDVSVLRAAYPDFHPRPLEAGLVAMRDRAT